MNVKTKRQMRTALLQGALLFSGSCVAVALTIHFAFIGKPLSLYAEIRSEKLAMLDGWKNRMSSAAFGSSHVHNGFDPRTFDRVLGNGTGQAETINLAISGGSQSEQYAMASQFLVKIREQDKPPSRCLVMLEFNAGANTQTIHLMHPRAINLYDTSVASLSLAFADRKLGLTSAAGRLAYASIASALHYMSIGMLSNAIFTPPLKDELIRHQTSADRRGLDGLASESEDSRDQRAVRDVVAADHSTRRTEAVPVTLGHELMLDRLSRNALPFHPTLIYFVSPSLEDLNVTKELPAFVERPAGTVPIINVARPDLYPELYQANLWHDPAHLNESGAAVFTDLLAREVGRWSAAHPSQLPCKS